MSKEVGKIHNLDGINNKLKELTSSWSEYIKNNFDLSSTIKFIIFALDQLIQVAKNYDIPGIDKKATVLGAFDKLYDFVVGNMPIWAKPIFIPIKQYVIYVLASILIDWVVSKYKEGSWKTEEKKEEVKSELYAHKSYFHFPEINQVRYTD